MTDPLIQAIERSRALELKIKNDKLDEMGEFLMQRSAQHAKFREALAIADAALDSIYKGYPNKTDSIPKKIAKARAEMRKLFEEVQ